MILLSEIFDQLAYGELSQQYISGSDSSGITVKDHKRIVPHINLALTELHKRFLLREEEVTIKCYDHIETYILDPKYAVTNTESTEPYKYIDDSEFEPFKDNVLRIEKVFNEDGQELYVNEEDPYIIHTVDHRHSSKAWTVSTPDYRTVQIAYPMEENALLVEYRASHEHIKVPGLRPDLTEIKIPHYLLQPMLEYVAARSLIGMGGNSAQEGTLQMQKFEASILKVQELNLVNRAVIQNQRLEQNGWV